MSLVMIEKYRGSHVVALFFSRAIIQLMEAPRQSAVSAVVGGEKKKKKEKKRGEGRCRRNARCRCIVHRNESEGPGYFQENSTLHLRHER